MFPVEIRYLDIQWSDPETVAKLEISRETLDCKESAKGWYVETTTFPGIFNTIGIRVTDTELKHTPFIELADGTCDELIQVKVPGQKDVWWIHSNGWSSNHKRHLSELYRTAGSAEVVVQKRRLTLRNHTFNFTVQELEHYLADFKNNLWMLILDSASVTRASVRKAGPSILSETLLELLYEVIRRSENLVQKPNVFLSETQERLPLRSVKPIAKTFREFAVNPHARTLTSRSYKESYDTPENRYVHHCIDRVRYLLKSLLRTVAAQHVSFKQRSEQEKCWIDQLKGTESRKVDPRVYDSEIATLKSQLSELERELLRLVTNNKSQTGYVGGQYGEYSIVLGGEYQGSKTNAFFGNRLNGKDFNQTYETFLVVVLPEEAVLPERLRRSGCEIRISGNTSKSKLWTSTGKEYYQLEFKDIESVSLVSHPLLSQIKRLLDGRAELEQNCWRVPLSPAELRERDLDIRAAENKLAIYQEGIQSLKIFSEHLPNLKSRADTLSAFFKKYRVKIASRCPNSMVFVQNPTYAGVKANFRKLMAESNLNESLLDSLMVIDEIGLVNVANLYERWCFLQVIKVLTETYGFCASEGWQNKLVNLVLDNRYDVKIDFLAPDKQQHITLTYEMTLPNGRRPDFVLDLISKKYYQDQKTLAWMWNDYQHSRLVMDAKFRGDVNEKHINKLVGELYRDKDYGQGETNKVFILHPTPGVIQDLTSPLAWGEYCDYGQTDNHQAGSIFLSPTKVYGDTSRHLQRLIGLFLQENSAILRAREEEKGSYAQWTNICCISCGNTANLSLRVIYSPTRAGSERWEISCGNCSLITIKTICSSCYVPLFKNGPEWTYHRTRATQISNVVCPSCQKFL